MTRVNKVIMGLLGVAVVFLLYVDIRQAQTIQAQRHLILEMWQFIQAECPFDQLH
jgi:hypothetical protein